MASLQEPSRAKVREAERNRQLEAAYRRGYHHGLVKTLDLIVGLLDSGMPRSVVVALVQMFEQQMVIPWRSAEAPNSSVPPHFDLEECQRFLREMKRHQST